MYIPSWWFQTLPELLQWKVGDQWALWGVEGKRAPGAGSLRFLRAGVRGRRGRESLSCSDLNLVQKEVSSSSGERTAGTGARLEEGEKRGTGPGVSKGLRGDLPASSPRELVPRGAPNWGVGGGGGRTSETIDWVLLWKTASLPSRRLGGARVGRAAGRGALVGCRSRTLGRAARLGDRELSGVTGKIGSATDLEIPPHGLGFLALFPARNGVTKAV